MRRLKNKIRIDPLSENLFRELLRRVCDEKQVPCTRELEDYMVQQCAQNTQNGFRGCFPRDLMNIICGIAAFEKRTPSLEKHYIDRAVKVYFAR
jgi:hypothetical protein